MYANNFTHSQSLALQDLAHAKALEPYVIDRTMMVVSTSIISIPFFEIPGKGRLTSKSPRQAGVNLVQEGKTDGQRRWPPDMRRDQKEADFRVCSIVSRK